jgi:probable rRNA maturation factor
MILTIANRQRARKINVRRLREIAAALLAELAGTEAALEISLVSPAQMARVNQTFLRHEGPTDVITFDYRETPPRQRSAPVPAAARPLAGRRSSSPANDAPLNGELFICPAVAVLQARQFSTVWRSELVRYLIHGLLHLLGHDDLDPVSRRRMKRVEGRLLRDVSRRFALSKL